MTLVREMSAYHSTMDVVFTHLRVDVEIPEGLPEIGGRKECPDLAVWGQALSDSICIAQALSQDHFLERIMA